MCGGDCTVAPHRYTPTSPGTTGVKSRTSWVAVSNRRRLTGSGYRRVVTGDHQAVAVSSAHPVPRVRPRAIIGG
jgi:hypothetical protein